MRFKTILAHIESRLDRLPILRQKLQRVPLDLDYPYWVDDENFDLEYHVRHIALPKPGDWRQFCIQASRIHARPLDLNRPLWEIYVIEGLDGFLDLPVGSFALLTKMHHAAIDVENGNQITTLLHDLERHAAGRRRRPRPGSPSGRPACVPHGRRAAWRTPWAPRRAWPGRSGRAVRRAAPAALTLAGDLLLRPHKLPATRFNCGGLAAPRVRDPPLHARRVQGHPRPGGRRHRQRRRAGGVRRRAAPLPGPLRRTARSPAWPRWRRSTCARRGGGGRGRPELTWLRVALGTDIADPLQRLAKIHEQTASSEHLSRAVGARELTEVGSHVPAATLALTAKLLGRATAGIGRRSPLAHCTITNVPGPTVPLYLCGARMTYFSAIMPIADGMGLVFAVTSYDGRIIISPTSCRELMPDPEVFAQCVRDSFQELLAAAQARPARPPHGGRQRRRRGARQGRAPRRA